MEKITKQFKGRNAIHIVLNPDDLDCIFSILTFSKNSLLRKFPWNNPFHWKTYAKVILWWENKIKSIINI